VNSVVNGLGGDSGESNPTYVVTSEMYTGSDLLKAVVYRLVQVFSHRSQRRLRSQQMRNKHP